MRIITLLVAIIIGSDLYGQTDSIERAKLNEEFLSRKIAKTDYNYAIKKWNETLKTTSYPELPLNSGGIVQYSYIIEFDDLGKEILFKRILEWLSLTYGIAPALFYSNMEDGKIICPNSVNIDASTTGTYTYVFTIKDRKVLLDFANIGYQVKSGGYYSGETWIPERIDAAGIDLIFPVIFKKITDWTYYLGVLKTLDFRLDGDLKSLNDYIGNYDSRYTF